MQKITAFPGNAHGASALHWLGDPGVNNEMGELGGRGRRHAEPRSGNRGSHDVMGHRGVEGRHLQVGDRVVRPDEDEGAAGDLSSACGLDAVQGLVEQAERSRRGEELVGIVVGRHHPMAVR